eukprot:5381399-Pyramimonas_sp.AAC.1
MMFTGPNRTSRPPAAAGPAGTGAPAPPASRATCPDSSSPPALAPPLLPPRPPPPLSRPSACGTAPAGRSVTRVSRVCRQALGGIRRVLHLDHAYADKPWEGRQLNSTRRLVVSGCGAWYISPVSRSYWVAGVPPTRVNWLTPIRANECERT